MLEMVPARLADGDEKCKVVALNVIGSVGSYNDEGFNVLW